MSLPIEKRRQWIKSRREQRKQTRYARLRRQFLRYSLLSLLLAAGLFAFYRMPCCLNKNGQGLVIHGNLVASNEQIADALTSAIQIKPLYSLDPKELEKRIQGLSVIKHAFVRRYLLPKPVLKVEVLEEFPWASVFTSPACQTYGKVAAKLANSKSASSNLGVDKIVPEFVMAESGRLISTTKFPDIYQPALKIYTQKAQQLCLGQHDVEQWANWLNYLSKQTNSPVIALDMREPHNIKVETGKFLIVLGNPDSGLSRRLNRLACVLEILASQHKEAAYIDLSLNSNIPVKLAKRTEKPLAEENSRL